MFWQRKNRKQESQVERVGREMVRAASAHEEELEAAATSPFLYARIRAAVNAGQSERAEAQDFSFSIFAVMKHALPLMILTATVSLMLLFAGTSTTGINTSDETAMETRTTHFERVVIDEDDLPLSSDEVLASIIVNNDDGDEGDQR